MPTKKGNSGFSTPKRQLVRWNDPLERADGVIDNLDRYLMLAMQSVCNNRGIKIPWDLVADTMGPPITEGAVVQHLAKLRQRMEESGQPVPPPLRRGGAVPITKVTRGFGSGAIATGTPRSVDKGTKRKVQASTGNFGDDEEEYGKAAAVKTEQAGGSSKKRGNRTTSKKAIKLEDSDDYDDTPVSKSRAKLKKQKRSSDDDDGDFKESATWPAKPTITRERKSSINYAELNGDVSVSETEEGAGGVSEDERKYLGSGAATFSRGNGPPYEELSTSRRKRSKVVKDEDEDSEYQVDSQASSRVGSVEGDIKGYKAHDNDNSNHSQQPYSLAPPSFSSPVPHSVEQVSNRVERNQMVFGQQMSASDFQRDKGYSTSSGNHGSLSSLMFPSIESLPMGPPAVSNNARHYHPSLGNNIRIDTNLANSSFPTVGNHSYSSNSTTVNTSHSSVDPSPNSTTVQSPLEMNFQQGGAYGNGFVGGHEDFDQPFLSSSLLDPNDPAWMEELFPGAGFGGASGMGDFDPFI